MNEDCKRILRIMIDLLNAVNALEAVKEAIGVPQNDVEKAILARIVDLEKFLKVLEQELDACLKT